MHAQDVRQVGRDRPTVHISSFRECTAWVWVPWRMMTCSRDRTVNNNAPPVGNGRSTSWYINALACARASRATGPKHGACASWHRGSPWHTTGNAAVDNGTHAPRTHRRSDIRRRKQSSTTPHAHRAGPSFVHQELPRSRHRCLAGTTYSRVAPRGARHAAGWLVDPRAWGPGARTSSSRRGVEPNGAWPP